MTLLTEATVSTISPNDYEKKTVCIVCNAWLLVYSIITITQIERTLLPINIVHKNLFSALKKKIRNHSNHYKILP